MNYIWKLWAFVGVFVVCQLWVIVESVSFEEDVRISLDQKKAIDKLRRRVQPYITEDFMNDDIYLVRWLRNSEYDMAQAEKRLIATIKWRKENKIATIDKEDFSDVSQEFPYSNYGFDKEGRPLFIAFAGDWDIRAAVVTGRVPRVLRYLDQGLENLSRRIRRYQQEGRNVTQGILLIELSQFSLVKHACPQCLFRIVQFLTDYEKHYPGMADKVIFLDAPPAVQFVIELIQQNSSKELKAAIKVFGTNKAQWQLQKHIDKQYLPVELGGTLQRN